MESSNRLMPGGHVLAAQTAKTSIQEIDLDQPLSAYGLVQVILLILTSLTGSTTNLAVVIVISMTTRLRTLGNVYILNQAVIDLLICSIFLPLHTAILAQNAPPGNNCNLIGPFVMWIQTASFLGLPAIAYSRYIITTKPRIEQHQYLGKCTMLGILTMIWVFPIGMITPAFFDAYRFGYSGKARDCAILQDPGVEFFLLFRSFVLFIGPVFITFFLYFQVFAFLKQDTNVPSTNMEHLRKRDAHVTRCLFIAFILCLLSLLPVNIAVLSDKQGDVSSVLMRSFISLTWLGKMTNPILYMWRNKLFLKSLWAFMYRLLGREDLRTQVRATSKSIEIDYEIKISEWV